MAVSLARQPQFCLERNPFVFIYISFYFIYKRSVILGVKVTWPVLLHSSFSKNGPHGGCLVTSAERSAETDPDDPARQSKGISARMQSEHKTKDVNQRDTRLVGDCHSLRKSRGKLTVSACITRRRWWQVYTPSFIIKAGFSSICCCCARRVLVKESDRIAWN